MPACLMGCGFFGSGNHGLCSSCEKEYASLPPAERPDLDQAAATNTAAAVHERQRRVAQVHRFVPAAGSGFERGCQVGAALRDRIIAVHNAATEVFPTGSDMVKWDAVAGAGLRAARQWAPTAVSEMEGMASVEGLTIEILSRVAVLYEMVRVPPAAVSGGLAEVAAAWELLQQEGVYNAGVSSLAQDWAAGDGAAHLEAAPDSCTSFSLHLASGWILSGDYHTAPHQINPSRCTHSGIH